MTIYHNENSHITYQGNGYDKNKSFQVNPDSLSHPDFCFRIYKLFNKLLLEFILNVH